ncbi:MHS family alpha-ketoglutarate permease-like MFS transporter [Arthrobacter woluwensis]|uniref:MFS transporter n=1 Tax=Arthrobacter woluwensis TaxID=156980 RepID=UPI00277DA7E5|nr:MFS transporter [Arthrobacter woluwensis]MDQ0707624.1 MHS family alpha-ketoglutarate permease-like MFS transporter [Arthrobacter woluwensis]
MSGTRLAPPAKQPTMGRAVANILKGSAGNLIEWYDLYVYAAFSSYFASSFFNGKDPAQAQIDAYLTFALTFLMRPVGSWFFGRFADRRGRRAALTVSVSLMGVGSLLVAVLPTVAQIGVWATVLMYASRLLQGFSVGGEYGTSATYMSEAAVSGKRGFFSSFQYVTLVGGQVLALLTLVILQQTLGEQAIHDWGWRIPFAIGAVASLLVLWLRRTMDETISTEQREAVRSDGAQPGTLKLLFTKHWKQFLVVVFFTMGGTCAFYLYTTYILSYMNNVSHIPKAQTSVINFWALLLFMLIQPLFGMLSDRIGRRTLLIVFGVLGTVFTWPIMSTLATVHDPLPAFLLMVAALLIVVNYTSVNAIMKAELFPSSVRALGVGLGYAVANSLFGGTTPLIGEWLSAQGHKEWLFTYVTITIALSLVVYLFFLPKDRPEDLD